MIAEFWAPMIPPFFSPPMMWEVFAINAARAASLNLEKSIKLLFLVSNAMFDAGIAAWDAKRFFNRT